MSGYWNVVEVFQQNWTQKRQGIVSSCFVLSIVNTKECYATKTWLLSDPIFNTSAKSLHEGVRLRYSSEVYTSGNLCIIGNNSTYRSVAKCP